MILPADSTEVSRLAATLDVLIGSPEAARTATRGGLVASAEDDASLQQRGWAAHLTRTSEPSRKNFVWEGVRGEIEAVASFDLAKAIDAQCKTRNHC